MRLPVMRGLIKRRILVNFRADPTTVRRLLPEPFRPKLYRGQAIVGICLVRLEQIRPAGLPALVGISSENAAHRIAVEWTGETDELCEGVFIPRRDTGSVVNQLAGGRIFPGEHHAAAFTVRDDGENLALDMRSHDGGVSVRLTGCDSNDLPGDSIFSSIADASAFFEGGSLGYSVTRDCARLDGLLLRTLEWRVRAFTVATARSSYYSDAARFPTGSIAFDHALIMRDLAHEWHQAADFRVAAVAETA
jgi:Uncharacterized conserved protein (COG2071)